MQILRFPYGTGTYALGSNKETIQPLHLSLFNYNGIQKDFKRKKGKEIFCVTPEYSEPMNMGGDFEYFLISRASYLKARSACFINNWETLFKIDFPRTTKNKRERGAYIYNLCKKKAEDEWNAMKEEYFVPKNQTLHTDLILDDDFPPEEYWEEKKENKQETKEISKPTEKKSKSNDFLFKKQNIKRKVMKNKEEIIKKKVGRPTKNTLKSIQLNPLDNSILGKGRRKIGQQIKVVWVDKHVKTRDFNYLATPIISEGIIEISKKDKVLV